MIGALIEAGDPVDLQADDSRPLVSLFAIPKPMVGHVGVIQRNALLSWVRLRPDVEVILLGNAEGTETIAQELEMTHQPHVAANHLGTPCLDDAFCSAHRLATGRVIAYANADLVLLADFVRAVRCVTECYASFLAIGRRTEMLIQSELDLALPAAITQLQDDLRQRGRIDALVCKDYFVFSRDQFQEIPPFAVGRGNWDNWMVYDAKRRNVPVIDLSQCVTAVHQAHDHHHVQGGRGRAYVSGEEAKANQRLAGGRHLISGSTANWVATEHGFVARRFPSLAFWRDLPRFLRLLRNLMFFQYILSGSAFELLT